LRIPRTHLLKDLLAMLQLQHQSLTRLRRGLVFLTRLAVGTRYPGGSASKRETKAALRWTDQGRTAAAGRRVPGNPPAPRLF